MSVAELYLRPDVVAEPLIDQWYAWPQLIAPATTALNVANRHVRMMESYVCAPDIHAAAAENPTLRGGPFIDLAPSRVAQIQELLSRTLEGCADLMQLAGALELVGNLLHGEARGLSLEPLYAKVPNRLRGYIELVYDLEGRPTVRLLEPMLYRSPYYVRAAQGFLLADATRYQRSFILSTPRFLCDGLALLKVPFDSPFIDRLFSSVRRPLGRAVAQELADLCPSELSLKSLLVDRPPPAPEAPPGGLRWRYFGHACVLIESATHSILVDPAFGYADGREPFRYTSLDLPQHIDYVLITHGHQDHCMLEMLLQIRHRVDTVVVPKSAPGTLQDPSLKLLLNNIGFRRVIDVDALECLEFAAGTITAVPFLGEHGDLDIRAKSAYLVRLGGRAFLFAADSRNVEPTLYELLRQSLGPVDTLFIGMECEGAPLSWTYGALLTGGRLTRAMDQSRRTNGSDCEQALAMVEALGCRRVYVYAMGQEPWFKYVSNINSEESSAALLEAGRLIEACQNRGIRAERLYGHKEVIESGTCSR